MQTRRFNNFFLILRKIWYCCWCRFFYAYCVTFSIVWRKLPKMSFIRIIIMLSLDIESRSQTIKEEEGNLTFNSAEEITCFKHCNWRNFHMNKFICGLRNYWVMRFKIRLNFSWNFDILIDLMILLILR